MALSTTIPLPMKPLSCGLFLALSFVQSIEAAESVGGVEYYLVEQEGSRFSELETASRCLQAFRARHTGR